MPLRDDLARRKMLGILAGSWIAQGCYALARLRIADAIGDGVVGVEEIAASTGTHPVALHRLLRALALAGLLQQPEPGRFALTPASNLLREDVEVPCLTREAALAGAPDVAEDRFRVPRILDEEI